MIKVNKDDSCVLSIAFIWGYIIAKNTALKMALFVYNPP